MEKFIFGLAILFLLLYILAGQDMIKNWIWTVPFSDKRGSLFVFQQLPKRKNGNGGINAQSPRPENMRHCWTSMASQS